MDCKEFKGLIQEFLHDELDVNMLSRFLEHIEECSDCRDELRTQYLIYEGLERLESGEPFDVDKDLAKVMQQQKNRIGEMLRISLREADRNARLSEPVSESCHLFGAQGTP